MSDLVVSGFGLVAASLMTQVESQNASSALLLAAELLLGVVRSRSMNMSVFNRMAGATIFSHCPGKGYDARGYGCG